MQHNHSGTLISKITLSSLGHNMKTKALLFLVAMACMAHRNPAQADGKSLHFPDPQVVAEYNAASPTAEGFSLTLKADESYYLVGEKVELTALLRNTGKENKKVMRTDGKMVTNYSLHLYSVTKKELKPTPNGKLKLLDERSAYSRSITVVRPGEEVKDNYSSITQVFDLSNPGTYQITAERSFPKSVGSKEWTTLTSNVVEITVGSEPRPDKAETQTEKPPEPPATPGK